MKHRKLRIAWSVAWGMMAVLLCLLWVRSYFHRVNVQLPPFSTCTFQFSLLPGRILIAMHDREPLWATGFWQIHKSDPNFENWDYPDSPTFLLRIRRFGPHDIAVHFPYWFPVAISTVLATVPWLRFRFSLRTLLTATTLVAVALGLIVWARSSH